MLRQSLVLTMIGCLVGAQAEASPYRVLDKARVVEVIDVIDADILDKAQKVEALSRESQEPIQLLINSPGGMVDTGFIFVDAMRIAKERGVRIECVVGVMAASMAFIILSECDKRVVLPNSMLLFHPISVSGRMRIEEALPSLVETVRRQRLIDYKVRRKMRLSADDYQAHSLSETLWNGEGLAKYTEGSGFLTVYHRIDGFDNLLVYRRARGSFFSSTNLELIPRVFRRLYE